LEAEPAEKGVWQLTAQLEIQGFKDLVLLECTAFEEDGKFTAVEEDGMRSEEYNGDATFHADTYLSLVKDVVEGQPVRAGKIARTATPNLGPGTMFPPKWLEAKGFTKEDWSEAVDKATEKGILKPGKMAQGAEYGAVVAIMKKLKQKREQNPVTAAEQPWRVLVAALERDGHDNGAWGEGEWAVHPEIFGRTAELHMESFNADGSLRARQTVAFNLIGKPGPTAAIEVSDTISNNTRYASLSPAKAQKLASIWLERAKEIAKGPLAN